MTKHMTGTRGEWLAARLALLEAEKELTRRSDELARRRQELPWVLPRVGMGADRYESDGRLLASPASTNSLSLTNHSSLSSNPGNAAFRPLGFGSTKTRAPPSVARLGPGPVSVLAGRTIRASDTPTRATTAGRRASSFRTSARTPTSYS